MMRKTGPVLTLQMGMVSFVYIGFGKNMSACLSYTLILWNQDCTYSLTLILFSKCIEKRLETSTPDC